MGCEFFFGSGCLAFANIVVMLADCVEYSLAPCQPFSLTRQYECLPSVIVTVLFCGAQNYFILPKKKVIYDIVNQQ